ncbi:MAG: non-heme iron oxygenase ferredoxin subunit [Candidatus Omnitrophica bacterium]|nr:non-heme iron oxygenase ferredoxin subunit [Candidatus Omnitrophota bacterium]
MSSWYTVAKTSEIAEGQGRQVRVPGRRKPFALFRYEGQFFVVDDGCPHAYASLSEGRVKDFLVSCPAHGANFDIRSGRGQGPYEHLDLRTLPVRVAGEEVQVEF